ncbi:MAG: AAA family ATPase [Candidatus Omnitrophota bacterium]
MIKRTVYLNLWNAISQEKQMIFLSGPRQVGKTTLSKAIAQFFPNNLYFNWDIISDKKQLISNPSFFQDINRVDSSTPLVILDEIHKYEHWKNYLKGMYDEFKDEYHFLISGSGRLDTYKKGGDSLAGRYFMFRLFPFTIAELSSSHRSFKDFIQSPLKGFDINSKNATKKHWDQLSKVSGFPEPFVNGTISFF